MTTLGKYELHEVIGKGGFGTVYRATDLALGRAVALKVLHPQWAVDPNFIDRFQREARLLASLEHPNIVWVSDVGEEQGRFYLVERYLSGGSLADRLLKGPLTASEARHILEEVCAGLQELHRQGWVHRDLKPANILFDAAGRVVITDFGLARAMAANAGSSSSSSGGAGTPFYRAPELWRGNPPVSLATDVYSLGCILGEMLTGKPLFGGDTPDEIITRHLVDGPDFGESWPPPGVPTWLAGVVQKAISKDPAQRYPDAQTFNQALATDCRSEEVAQATSPEAEQARYAAEEDVRQQQAAEREKARMEAELQTRQQAAEREKARLTAEAQTQREWAARASQMPTLTAAQPASRNIPWWGWLVGASVLLALLFFAVRGIVLPASTTPEPMQAPVVVPTTAAPTAERAAAPAVVPTAVPTAEPDSEPTADPNGPRACTQKGQTWVSPVDRMTLVCVPAGKFTMGSNDGDNDEDPVREVYLDAYWMDQTEVTNGQYALCVAAGECTEPAYTVSYTRHSYYGDAQYVNYPVIHVDWYRANAYCAWAKRSLPTEAQWEKAARGTDGRTYPWGDGAPTCALTNFDPFEQGDGSACVDDTTAVGSYPKGASPYGALDMSGNVWEWIADWYGAYPLGEQSNPHGPGTGQYRVVRGGSWYNDEYLVRLPNRFQYIPGFKDYYFGFRCALTLP